MTGQPDLIPRGLGATDAQLFGTAPATYRLWIRDYRCLRVAELTDWTSFSFVRRFNGIGTWTLETSAESREARLLLKNGGIIVTRTVNGITSTIFSGFVKSEWAWTARTFRAAGLSDDAHLADVLARPVPSQDTGPYAVDAYVYGPAPASTAMWELVRVMCGPAAPGLWNNAPIVMGVNPIVGASVTVRGNLQPVMTILRELAADPQSGGLGFTLIQSDTQAGKLEFRLFVPEDRTAQAKFTIALNTIADYEDVWTMPDGNYFVVLGGDGYGKDRTIVEGGDDASASETGRRTARVIDKRGSTDLGELHQALAEALALTRSSRRSAVEPFELQSLQFGVDYDFGDLVTVITHGGEQVDLIRGIAFAYDPEQGPRVTPLVGEGTGDDEVDRQARYLATVQDRLSNLERNWSTPDDAITNAMLRAASVRPVNLDASTSPADGLLPVYDAASERFAWITADALIDTLTLSVLTVTGTATASRFISTIAPGTAPLQVASTTLVPNLNAGLLGGVSLAGLDDRYVEIDGDTMTGALTVPGLTNTGATALGTDNADLVAVTGILRVQNAAGTLTPLYATGPNGRVQIGNVTPLSSAPASYLEVIGNRSYFAANSELVSIGLRYAPSTPGQVYLGASNSTTPDLILSNTGGSQIGRFTHAGLFMAGAFAAPVGTAGPADVQCEDLWLVDGANYRRLLANGATFQIGDNAGSGTDLSIDASGVVTIKQLEIDSGGAEITGPTLLHGSITVDPGQTATFGGQAAFNDPATFTDNPQVVGTDLNMSTSYVDFDASTTAGLSSTAGFTNATFSGWYAVKVRGTVRYVPYYAAAPS